MAGTIYPGENVFPTTKAVPHWSDVVFVGGSIFGDSGAGTQFLWGSGGQAIAYLGQVLIVGSVQAQGRGIPVLSLNNTNAISPYIQAGSGATGAGSNVWVTFNEVFTGVPLAFASTACGSGWSMAGSPSVGSCYVTSMNPSEPINWLAIGTK